MKPYKCIISGGGTGGHIYPAIAIADEIRERHPNTEFLFVGAKNRMEMTKVPAAGYSIKGLWISGIERKISLKNFLFPFKLLASLWRSLQIIRSFRPDLVVGTGGFASGPLLYVASKKNIPTLIQEQNSYAGITNKWLSKSVDRICVAYQNMERFFPKQKIIVTGNPVRKNLREMKVSQAFAYQKMGLDSNKKTLLVLGGSLGARRINQLIESQLDFFKEQHIQVVWQCGKFYLDQYKRFSSKSVQVKAFIDEMNVAYAAADIIISRAGASAVSELCIVGKPVIFIPSPNVSEDHQTKNANAVVDNNAAIMIKESDLDQQFRPFFLELLNDSIKIEQLKTNIKKMALPNATKAIVNEIETLLS